MLKRTLKKISWQRAGTVLVENGLPVLGVLVAGWNLFCVIFSSAAQQFLTAHFQILRSLELRLDLPDRTSKTLMGLLAFVMQPVLLFGVVMCALQIFHAHHPIDAKEASALFNEQTAGEITGLAASVMVSVVAEIQALRAWTGAGCQGTDIEHAQRGLFGLLLPMLWMFACGFAIDDLGCPLKLGVVIFALFKTVLDLFSTE